ncbi:chemokine-like receptor 1 [Polypterus senegalus]|uniref:chemokine-like receptor 1 n=1 Tax=Polypterus senegalus TaxID=55291 RepID=UPI001963399E|nr:chemokine-like receptor 1 [Polypterus senegalus]
MRAAPVCAMGPVDAVMNLTHGATQDGLKKHTQVTISHVNLFLCTIIFITGLTGNGVVIWLTGFRMRRSEFNIWFLNLALSDLSFIIWLPLRMASFYLQHWPFGSFLCKGYYFLSTVNVYTSAFILMVVSIDRCVSVASPVWYRNHRPRKLATQVCAVIWVLTFTISSPLAIFSKLKSREAHKVCEVDVYLSSEGNLSIVGTNQTSAEQQERLRTLGNILGVFMPIFTCGYLIPLTVITSSYSIIIYKLRRMPLSPGFIRPYRVIAAAVLSFFITWMPSRVLGFVQLLAVYSVQHEALYMSRLYLPLASTFGYMNGCINPIIYVLIRKEFRDKLGIFKGSFLRSVITGGVSSNGLESYNRSLPGFIHPFADKSPEDGNETMLGMLGECRKNSD